MSLCVCVCVCVCLNHAKRNSLSIKYNFPGISRIFCSMRSYVATYQPEQINRHIHARVFNKAHFNLSHVIKHQPAILTSYKGCCVPIHPHINIHEFERRPQQQPVSRLLSIEASGQAGINLLHLLYLSLLKNVG